MSSTSQLLYTEQFIDCFIEKLAMQAEECKVAANNAREVDDPLSVLSMYSNYSVFVWVIDELIEEMNRKELEFEKILENVSVGIL